MRYKPEERTTRVVERFILFPMTLPIGRLNGPMETRCLEVCSVIQVRVYNEWETRGWNDGGFQDGDEFFV